MCRESNSYFAHLFVTLTFGLSEIFGKAQINLVFRSLIRNFVPVIVGNSGKSTGLMPSCRGGNSLNYIFLSFLTSVRLHSKQDKEKYTHKVSLAKIISKNSC